jgi:hypothetical protein
MNQDTVIAPQVGARRTDGGATTDMAYTPITRLRRALFVAVGTVALGLGILGAYVPGMPSTVFFLIALGSYARSSERLHHWMLTRPWLQGPLRAALTYSQHKAVPVRIKIVAQSVAWSSALFLIFSGRTPIAQFMGIALAASCTIAMALLRTLDDGKSPRRWTSARGDMWRQLGYGIGAGVIAAALWVIAAAGVLRFAANLGVGPAFSFAALPVLAAGALPFGGVAGAAYAALRHGLPANQWLRGAAFGAACAALVGIFAAASGAAAWSTSWLTPALLGVAVVLAGLTASLIFGQFERRPTATVAARRERAG